MTRMYSTSVQRTDLTYPFTSKANCGIVVTFPTKKGKLTAMAQCCDMCRIV